VWPKKLTSSQVEALWLFLGARAWFMPETWYHVLRSNYTHTHSDQYVCVCALFLCKAHKEKFFRVSPP